MGSVTLLLGLSPRICLRFHKFITRLAPMSEFATVPLLLVEDNESDAFILQRALKTVGVSNPLFVVKDGEEAIKYLSGQPPYHNRAEFPLPYLVLLDLKLPKLGGFEVLRHIRATLTLRHLLVVVLTSSDLDYDIKKAFEAGADSYLVKPGELSELEELVFLLKKHWLMLDRIVDFRRETAQV